jgi:hypothetical protein
MSGSNFFAWLSMSSLGKNQGVIREEVYSCVFNEDVLGERSVKPSGPNQNLMTELRSSRAFASRAMPAFDIAHLRDFSSHSMPNGKFLRH